MTNHNSCNFETDFNKDQVLSLMFSGSLNSQTAGSLWKEVFLSIDKINPRTIIIDASQITYCDGSGIGLFLEISRRGKKKGVSVEIKNLSKEFQELFSLFSVSDISLPEKEKKIKLPFPEEVGKASVQISQDIYDLIGFVGEMLAAFVYFLFRPLKIRWKDTFLAAERAGVNAFPIVVLVSFLMGLILAFQSAIPLDQFGAVIFVSNLVAISMVRELGPLMTAIVLVGRSGSAFAAEIGTMKINEEVNALTTMGLDPLKFLVIPRVIAAVVMTPLITVFANLMGILGGSVVLMTFGFPFKTYMDQVIGSLTLGDFLGGIFKAFIFGILVAGIGCLRGLQTKTGASAVGESTTSAVVSGIVLIVLTDGLFAVLYYSLGI